MASLISRIILNGQKVAPLRTIPIYTASGPGMVPARTMAIYNATGGVLARPVQIRVPLPKVLLTVLPPLGLGAGLAAWGAEFLEEHDIFTADDDDD